MSRFLCRHELPVDSRRHVLGVRGEIVCVTARGLDRVDVWVMHDTGLPAVDRVLRVVGSGDPLDDDLVYVGTAPTRDGAVVWHVMEVVAGKGLPAENSDR